MALSAALVQTIRETLLETDEIADFSLLRSLFTTQQLQPFRAQLPKGNSPKAQADLLIDMLHNRALVSGENALALCLEALATRYEGQQLQVDLRALAQQVAGATGSRPAALDLPTAADEAPSRSRQVRLVSPTPDQDGSLPQIKQRYALLIGVRDYEDPSFRTLPHTVPDVVELGKLLTGAGYTVHLLYNDPQQPQLQPTRNRILGALGNLLENTGPGDLLLIHFGGHGTVDRDGVAYLLATDSFANNLADTAISLQRLHNLLEKAATQAKVLILDACHSGIGRSGGQMDPAFERHVFLEAAGTAVLASCRHQQVAFEHDQSPHGAFTYFLLAGLRGAAAKENQRYITFHDIQDYVTVQVKQWAIAQRRQQQPNAESKLEGDPPLIELVSNPAPSVVPNPFGATLAIKDAARFIGRAAELRRLQTMLQMGSASLIGLPKIGKSSLLWQLKQQWPGKTIGPIDFQMHDREDFFALLGDDVALTARDWRRIRDKLLAGKALILIDEFDSAPGKGITVEDMKLLRGVCNMNADLHVLTASRLELRQLLPDSTGSEWYNYLPPHTLGALTAAEATQLLTHPWVPEAQDFAPTTVAELLALTAHHPYQLQCAAFHCYEQFADPAYDWRDQYTIHWKGVKHE